MKYNDLTAKQKELLNAFIQGETLEVKNAYHKWVPLEGLHFSIDNLESLVIRIKPREPVVVHRFSPMFNDGTQSHGAFNSIREIWQVFDDITIHSFIMRTYHDGKFVKAEIIPKLELELKGLG